MAAPRGLHRLARLHGVQTAFRDNDGRRVGASGAVLLEALRAMRVPVADGADLPRLLAHRERERWERVLEPVVVAWQTLDWPAPAYFTLRMPVHLRDQPVRAAVRLEDGGLLPWTVEAGRLAPAERAEVDGIEFVALRAPLPDGLPIGYHDLVLTVGPDGSRGRFEALLVSAPRTAAPWDAVAGRRGWGLFAPLHSLWEEPGGGADAASPPTYRLLDRLAELVAERGGSVVGTLPLMASFLDTPYEPSPYAPVTRLFWNELYLEPPGGPDPEPGMGPYRGGLFDPRAAMAARRPALEAAARAFFGDGEPSDLESFRARNPEADDYARFRALVARWGTWGGWPDRLRGRDVRPEDYDQELVRYHLYVQWLAERQLTALKERVESRGVALYLDLPLGVHPDGYDVWRERELFALDASAGAPPDQLAPGGQDWGFPPLHPEAGRLDRHRYFIACIRNHLRFARVLRIDHVMQLHRMYWVLGGDARQGVYVRHPADELYAILCVESRRARAVVVGEDLGTVPRTVRQTMRRHGLPGMYVLQFELDDVNGGERLRPRRVPRGALASIGTHDTPTFAGWWWARDVAIRHRLGQGSDQTASAETAGRGVMRRKLAAGLGLEAGEDGDGELARHVHDRLLRWLGASDAGLVLATMEDLWLEPEPQNVPGTTRAENWRRQSRWPIERLGQPDVVAQLDELNQAREGRHG
jgi:4-alpha-glucanotransferase